MYNPTLLADFYKLSHPRQYPPGTEYVYSNTTPRSSRMDDVESVVVFGVQYLIEEYIVKNWQENFFKRPKDEVIGEFKRLCDYTLGSGAVDESIFADLHDLGYLPLHIKALPEGTRCPIQVPFMTIRNTHPKFFWLTNFVETLTQTVLWQAITSATIADQYRQLLTEYAEETSSCPEFVTWQGHDFSMRGISSVESCAISDAAHLLSFTGTDTIPGILFLEKYYGADITQGLVGGSVAATEHAVMCAGGMEDEAETYRRLIEDTYQAGIISIVSDTWDYWNTLLTIIPSLKDKILGRNGKVVIRPDSGDPVKIVTGYFPKNIKNTAADYLAIAGDGSGFHRKIWQSAEEEGFDCVKTCDGRYFDIYGEELAEHEVKGSIALLYETFGGTINSKGFKELDPHIGLIYGDSITLSRCEQICERLSRKLFASTNVVFGIGSYTYQYVTRDTFGIACKATHVVINGQPKAIFKDPKTGGGKKSAKGLLSVQMIDGQITLMQECTEDQEKEGMLDTVFLDGEQYNKQSLDQIRNLLGEIYVKN